jgi:hypothetical protein
MRIDSFAPKALREANRQLTAAHERIRRITPRKNPPKKKGLLSRLFGRFFGK